MTKAEAVAVLFFVIVGVVGTWHGDDLGDRWAPALFAVLCTFFGIVGTYLVANAISVLFFNVDLGK